MARPERPWVLDTSIATAWFFTDEPLRAQAMAVRDHLGRHPDRYVVPILFYAELVHVLARKSARDLAFVREALALILRLGIGTLAPSERALVRSVHWTCRGLSGYDATFVSLAEDIGGRWLTSDQRAARIGGRERVQLLSSWVRAPREASDQGPSQRRR